MIQAIFSVLPKAESLVKNELGRVLLVQSPALGSASLEHINNQYQQACYSNDSEVAQH